MGGVDLWMCRCEGGMGAWVASYHESTGENVYIKMDLWRVL